MITLYKRITYWLAWKLAGERIWNKSLFWAAEHIYLANKLERVNGCITLPDGITLATEPLELSSDTELDGRGQIFTSPANQPGINLVVFLAGSERCYVHHGIFLPHLDNTAIMIEPREWVNLGKAE